jgi:hypothetical protein
MLAERDKPILAVLAILVLAACTYWGYRISDTHRLSLFHEHKPQYEILLGMLQHDRVLAFINAGLTVPQDPATVGISPQRISQYRQYMSDIDCGAITFEPALGSALFVSGTIRAADILYFPVERRPQQAHRIEGSWYLASERF